MTDERKECGDVASLRYTWPGKDETYACVNHAVLIQTVAHVMGLHLQMIPISYKLDNGMPDLKKCTNRTPLPDTDEPE